MNYDPKKGVAQDKPSIDFILDRSAVCYGLVGLVVFLPIVLCIIVVPVSVILGNILFLCLCYVYTSLS